MPIGAIGTALVALGLMGGNGNETPAQPQHHPTAAQRGAAGAAVGSGAAFNVGQAATQAPTQSYAGTVNGQNVPYARVTTPAQQAMAQDDPETAMARQIVQQQQQTNPLLGNPTAQRMSQMASLTKLYDEARQMAANHPEMQAMLQPLLSGYERQLQQAMIGPGTYSAVQSYAQQTGDPRYDLNKNPNALPFYAKQQADFEDRLQKDMDTFQKRRSQWQDRTSFADQGKNNYWNQSTDQLQGPVGDSSLPTYARMQLLNDFEKKLANGGRSTSSAAVDAGGNYQDWNSTGGVA